MSRIHKMPFILAGVATMAAGMISYAAGINNQLLYLRMAVVMLVFFILGKFIKNTILAVTKEVEEKKERDAIEKRRMKVQSNEE